MTFTSQHIDILRKEFGKIKAVRMTLPMQQKLTTIIMKASIEMLSTLEDAEIKFVSAWATIEKQARNEKRFV